MLSLIIAVECNLYGGQVRVDVIHFKRLCRKRKEHLTLNEIIASHCVILEKSFKFTNFYQLATTFLLETYINTVNTG